MKFGHFIHFLSKTKINNPDSRTRIFTAHRFRCTPHTFLLLSTVAPPRASLRDKLLQLEAAYFVVTVVQTDTPALPEKHCGLLCREGTSHQVQLKNIRAKCPLFSVSAGVCCPFPSTLFYLLPSLWSFVSRGSSSPQSLDWGSLGVCSLPSRGHIPHL